MLYSNGEKPVLTAVYPYVIDTTANSKIWPRELPRHSQSCYH